MQLEPERLAVLRSSEARLTCSTSKPWTVMMWRLNNVSLLIISSEHGVLHSRDPKVTAEDRSTLQRSSWVLVLQATELRDQGRVTCDLPGVGLKTASLFVQGAVWGSGIVRVGV